MSEKGNKTFYELLGLDRTASQDQIKEAYKELAKIFHPDSHFYDEILGTTSSPQAAEKFKNITDAYNTLTNPSLKAEYDKTLAPELSDWDSTVPSSSRTISEKFRNTKGDTNFGKIYKRTGTPVGNIGPSMAELMKKSEKQPNMPVVYALIAAIIVFLIGVFLIVLIRK